MWLRVIRFGLRQAGRTTDVSSELEKLAQSLCELAEHPKFFRQSLTPVEKVFRDQADLRFNALSVQLAELIEHKLVFESTETWRVVYEQVLQYVKAQRYLSVAVIRSEDYWRDKPARESLAFNFDMIKHGFHIHRVFIVDDFFWAPSARRPVVQLYDWIMDQASYGLEISLVRKSALETETDLICDFGIYGEEAVGTQQSDFQGKTTRYEINFEKRAVKEAEDRWDKLLLFVDPLTKL